MKKQIAALVVCGAFAALGTMPAHAEGSYTYSTYKGNTTYKTCPDPYILEEVYCSTDLGVRLVSPKDICFDAEGRCYLLDSELSLVYVLDQNMSYIDTIDGFIRNGQKESFSKPQGMALLDTGELYICDTQNSRIIVLNRDYTLKSEYLCPDSSILGSQYLFKPKKIAVDSAKNMYIINSDEYQGVMQLDETGNFIAFIGSDKVKYDPVQLLWKKILSKEQSEQLVKFIPVEYYNLSMDNAGFIYAVSAATGKEPIKRLNLSGTDVLNRYGYVDVCGDIDTENSEEFEPSLFTDITANSNGVYFVLDSVKSRIFTYNRDGYLLYSFTDRDSLQAPSAIEVFDNRLYVTDIYDGAVAVYTISDFGRLVMEADDSYSKGFFENSFSAWEKVLRLNANYELAYAQMGRIYLRDGNYEKAMEYFEKGNFRGSEITQLDGYNKAFVEWRKQWAAENFGGFMLALLGTLLLYAIWKIWKRRQRKNES